MASAPFTCMGRAGARVPHWAAGGTEDTREPLAMERDAFPHLHLAWGGWAAPRLRLGVPGVMEGLELSRGGCVYISYHLIFMGNMKVSCR